MVKLSRCLTIFEGPDGSGKTTAAREYAEAIGARYVHFKALPRVKSSLGRMYVEAMLPALLGYQDVVFDRCWLSERPYGKVFRGGIYRLSSIDVRMLERLAMRCNPVMVRCQPPLETVVSNYVNRKGKEEMLVNIKQLKAVYRLYTTQFTSLPKVIYDYGAGRLTSDIIEAARVMDNHPIDVFSAGNYNAKFIFVGASFGERKDNDPFYQWPFASFSYSGCSQWLTNQLEHCVVGEDKILWVNADQDLTWLTGLGQPKIFAFGKLAYTKLRELGVEALEVPHPQSWRRFKSHITYPLVKLLAEMADE